MQTLHDKYHVPVEAPGAGQLPSPGDVISLSLNGALPGHVAVVIAVDAPMGNGTITVMEQNSAASGRNTITVSNWTLSYHGLFNRFLWTVQARHADSAVLMRHRGAGGYRVAPDGTIVSIGVAPALQPTATWPGHDIVRGAVLRSNNTSGYVLDGYGGLHPFGDATPVTVSAYWSVWNIAAAVVITHGGTGPGGYVLDGYGGMHPFGAALTVVTSGYHAGVDSAVAAGMTSNGAAGYEVDSKGTMTSITGSTSACTTCL